MAAKRVDLRTTEGRRKRPELQRRACELRRRHWTLDRIADEIGVAPSTVSALLWEGLGVGGWLATNREVDHRAAQKALKTKDQRRKEREAAERAANPKWTIDVPEERGEDGPIRMWNGAGKLYTDLGLIEIELCFWKMMFDGEMTWAPDEDGGSTWTMTLLGRARAQPERTAGMNRERAERLFVRWHEGASIREIAAELGTSANALGVGMVRLRKCGWDLPYREGYPRPPYS